MTKLTALLVDFAFLFLLLSSCLLQFVKGERSLKSMEDELADKMITNQHTRNSDHGETSLSRVLNHKALSGDDAGEDHCDRCQARGHGDCTSYSIDGYDGSQSATYYKCRYCNNNKYGDECKSSCSSNCGGNGSCVQQMDGTKQEGDCNHGCKNNKYYRRTCDRSCSSRCKNGTCHKSNGHCNQGCKDNKYYGSTCQHTCSAGCSGGTCNANNGHCSCRNGWHGDKCHILDCKAQCEDKGHGHCTWNGIDDDECNWCKVGWYGTHCQHECSEGCEGDGSCGRREGECHGGCKNGWGCGDKCPTQLQNCPDNCNYIKAESCDQCTGKCKCKNHWTGSDCSFFEFFENSETDMNDIKNECNRPSSSERSLEEFDGFNTACLIVFPTLELLPGEILTSERALTSENGKFILKIDHRGELKVMRGVNDYCLWRSRHDIGNWKDRQPYTLRYHDNNNLTLEDTKGLIHWQSNSIFNGCEPGRLVMQNDGNLVLYSKSGKWLWKSNTAGDNSYNDPDGSGVKGSC